MSSFDDIECISPKIRKEINCVFKYSQVELNIERFITTINGNIAKLKDIRKFIYKCEDAKEKKRLTVDSRRVLQQLSSILRSLQSFKSQVAPVDWQRFDDDTAQIIARAEDTIRNCHQVEALVLEHEASQDSTTIFPQSNVQLVDSSPNPQITEDRIAELTNDIQDINDVMLILNNNVKCQGESINIIDNNLQTTHDNVEDGAKLLATASRYKYATLSTTAALIGGAICGPLGLVVGFKLGALAALSGSALGFTGGKLLSKKQTEHLNNEEEVNTID